MRGSGRIATSLVLGAVLLAQTACDDAVVRGGLSEQDANQIAVALDRAGIAAEKRAEPGAGSFAVQVAPGDAARALQVLAARRLPDPTPRGFQALYGDPGLLETPREERVRWAAAASAELSRSLERMPGAVGARVHLALPDAPAALDAAREPPKASVLLERRGGAPPIDEAEVRALVAGAVEGLEPAQVTVVQVVAEREPPRAASLTAIGPFAVSARSAPALKLLLTASLGLDLLMAVALLAVLRRARRARGTQPES